jgi:hypothetical protein
VKRRLWPTSIRLRAEGDKLGRQTLLCSAIYDFVHLARISSISPYSRKTSKDSFASRLINYKLVHPLCSKRIAKPGKAGIAKIACRSESCSAKSFGRFVDLKAEMPVPHSLGNLLRSTFPADRMGRVDRIHVGPCQARRLVAALRPSRRFRLGGCEVYFQRAP